MKPALVVALIVACIVLSRTSSFARGGVAHGPAFEAAGPSEHLRDSVPAPEAPAANADVEPNSGSAAPSTAAAKLMPLLAGDLVRVLRHWPRTAGSGKPPLFM
jgi:hypothetical protein